VLAAASRAPFRSGPFSLPSSRHHQVVDVLKTFLVLSSPMLGRHASELPLEGTESAKLGHGQSRAIARDTRHHVGGISSLGELLANHVNRQQSSAESLHLSACPDSAHPAGLPGGGDHLNKRSISACNGFQLWIGQPTTGKAFLADHIVEPPGNGLLARSVYISSFDEKSVSTGISVSAASGVSNARLIRTLSHMCRQVQTEVNY
jgi:hypothetical protein